MKPATTYHNKAIRNEITLALNTKFIVIKTEAYKHDKKQKTLRINRNYSTKLKYAGLQQSSLAFIKC